MRSHMDRNARMLSAGAGLVAMLVIGYLAINPRGISPSRGAGVADREAPDLSEVLPDTSEEPENGPGNVREREAISDPWLLHRARLQEAGLNITHAEIAALAGGTAYDVVARTRPYWLVDELDVRVRVDGQLFGDAQTLRDIPIAAIDSIRLEFHRTEPHWILQVMMR